MSAPGNCVLSVSTPNNVTPQPILAGAIVRILMAFTDVTGAPTNPTTVTAHVGTTSYDEISLTAVNDSTGFWHADWDTTSATPGSNYCDVAGTGTIQTMAEILINVKAPRL